jgi:hypothetical protein
MELITKDEGITQFTDSEVAHWLVQHGTSLTDLRHRLDAAEAKLEELGALPSATIIPLPETTAQAFTEPSVWRKELPIVPKDPDVELPMKRLGDMIDLPYGPPLTKPFILVAGEGPEEHAIAIVIPPADYHDASECCCSNCPWGGDHG